MTDAVFNELDIEKIAAKQFKKKLEIKQVIVNAVPASRTSSATLFVAANNQVYLYIHAEASMILDDVRKITHRMGLIAEEFLPPLGNKEYFDTVGVEKFKSTFPGRSIGSLSDVRFYRLLAPYNPALVKIGAVKAGEVKQFDLDSGQWRHAAKFSYRKVTPNDLVK